MSGLKFQYLTGDPAYLAWYLYNGFQSDLEIMIVLDQHLEIIISDDGDVLAYRYDHPPDMRHLVKDDGIWRFTEEGEACKYRVKTAQVHRVKTAQLSDVKVFFPLTYANSFLPGKEG